MKRNFKMTIRYDGSRYQGWESQPGVEMTIEGKIETVLERMLLEEKNTDADKKPLGKAQEKDSQDKEDNIPVKVIASGRTDAGVHALGQVANVHLDTNMTAQDIQNYMNRYLPDDIAIEDLKDASERFHARYNALGKTYRYTCYYGESKPVFDRKYVTVLDEKPDISKMRQGAEYLIGTHDFKSFSCRSCEFSVLCFKDFSHSLGRNSSKSNFKKRSRQDSYHILKKSITMEIHSDIWSLFFDLYRVYTSDCRLLHSRIGTKALKIMCAY